MLAAGTQAQELSVEERITELNERIGVAEDGVGTTFAMDNDTLIINSYHFYSENVLVMTDSILHEVYHIPMYEVNAKGICVKGGNGGTLKLNSMHDDFVFYMEDNSGDKLKQHEFTIPLQNMAKADKKYVEELIESFITTWE